MSPASLNQMKIIQINLFLIGLFFSAQSVLPQKKILDSFETFSTLSDWKIYKSDGVETEVSIAEGHSVKGIRFDYNFTKGTGYGGIQKIIPLDIPENFQISFYIKGESPSNNFEFKLIDATGENVWWVNNWNYTFPSLPSNH